MFCLLNNNREDRTKALLGHYIKLPMPSRKVVPEACTMVFVVNLWKGCLETD